MQINSFTPAGSLVIRERSPCRLPDFALGRRQPLLEAADVRAVIDAYAHRGPARAVVPRVQQRRGHPVMLDAGVCSEILRGHAGYGAREWLDEHPDEVAWLDSDNLHYVEDVDFPEDLERIAQRHGCAMRWATGA